MLPRDVRCRPSPVNPRWVAGGGLLNRVDLARGYYRQFPNPGNVNAVTKLLIRKLLLTAQRCNDLREIRSGR